MSDQTEAALNDAIRAHFADEQPGFIATHWLGIIVGVGEEDHVTAYLRHSSDMPDWQHVGLAETLKLQVGAEYMGKREPDA